MYVHVYIVCVGIRCVACGVCVCVCVYVVLCVCVWVGGWVCTVGCGYVWYGRVDISELTQ